MGLYYYSLLLLFPIGAGIIASTTLSVSLWKAIKQAYYLFVGYFILYAAIMLLLLSLSRFILPMIVNFLLFAAGYCSLFFVKSYIFTEQHEILENLPGGQANKAK